MVGAGRFLKYQGVKKPALGGLGVLCTLKISATIAHEQTSRSVLLVPRARKAIASGALSF